MKTLNNRLAEEPKEEAVGYQVGDVLKGKKCSRCSMPISECSKTRWTKPLCVVGATEYEEHTIGLSALFLPRPFPTEGNNVFYITEAGVSVGVYSNAVFWKILKAFGNFFKTREEAEAKLEKIKNIK